jgi:predicted transposase YbfD/YdcC
MKEGQGNIGSVAGFWVLFSRLKKYHGRSEMTFKKIKYFSILLIALLDLTGQTVTMDAMGTQKDIAEKIN